MIYGLMDIGDLFQNICDVISPFFQNIVFSTFFQLLVSTTIGLENAKSLCFGAFDSSDIFAVFWRKKSPALR